MHKTFWPTATIQLTITLVLGQMLPTRDIEVLIPRPSCKVLRVHTNGDGRSLQELMGMEDDEGQFKQITRYILNRCKYYNVDTRVRYYLHDQDVLMKVKEKILHEFPMLRKYEDGWPITAYLKRELKQRKGRVSVHKPSVNHRGHHAACHTVLGAASQGWPGTFPMPTPRRSKRVNHAFILIPPRKSTFVPATVANGSSKEPREGPQIPLSTCGNTSNRGPQSTSPMATQDPVATVPSPARPSNTVLGWIVSFNIPLADAQRITELFASLGISDMAYLRALARMESRDAWLREMRENGELSEIQMRILRDMLERVAAQ